MTARIQDLTFANGPAGKKLLSFALVSSDANVSVTAAWQLVDHAELRSLPEPMTYDSKAWYGIGPGCPLRMKVEGEGQAARLLVMCNFPYAEPALTEPTALLLLPTLLMENHLLGDEQAELLRRQIEATFPNT